MVCPAMNGTRKGKKFFSKRKKLCTPRSLEAKPPQQWAGPGSSSTHARGCARGHVVSPGFSEELQAPAATSVAPAHAR